MSPVIAKYDEYEYQVKVFHDTLHAFLSNPNLIKRTYRTP